MTTTHNRWKLLNKWALGCSRLGVTLSIRDDYASDRLLNDSCR